MRSRWCEKCGKETSHEHTKHGWLKCVSCGYVGGFLTKEGASVDESPKGKPLIEVFADTQICPKCGHLYKEPPIEFNTSS